MEAIARTSISVSEGVLADARRLSGKERQSLSKTIELLLRKWVAAKAAEEATNKPGDR